MCCLCLTTWTASLFSITNVFTLSDSPGGFVYFCLFLQNQPPEVMGHLCICCAGTAYTDLLKGPLTSEYDWLLFKNGSEHTTGGKSMKFRESRVIFFPVGHSRGI